MPTTLQPLTRAQINRANAQKSTGPKTKEGKARSAQNALKHGLRATKYLLPPPPPEVESSKLKVGSSAPHSAIPNPQSAISTHLPPTLLVADSLASLRRRDLEKELRPSTPTQHILLDELVHLERKLETIRRAEFRILNTNLGDTTPRPLDLKTMSPPSQADLQLAATDPGAEIVAHHFLTNPHTLTTLWSYQLRFLARYQSILRQIPKLANEASKLHQQDKEAADLQHRLDLDARIALYEKTIRENPTPIEPTPAPAPIEPTEPGQSAIGNPPPPIPHPRLPHPPAPNQPTAAPAPIEPTTPPLEVESSKFNLGSSAFPPFPIPHPSLDRTRAECEMPRECALFPRGSTPTT